MCRSSDSGCGFYDDKCSTMMTPRMRFTTSGNGGGGASAKYDLFNDCCSASFSMVLIQILVSTRFEHVAT